MRRNSNYFLYLPLITHIILTELKPPDFLPFCCRLSILSHFYNMESKLVVFLEKNVAFMFLLVYKERGCLTLTNC